MSKHGPCDLGLLTCVPYPLAWWECPNGRTVRLCKPCLDLCFDSADNDPDSEPLAWGWLIPPAPAPTDVAAWVRDPHNHTVVIEILRREARIDPGWLHGLLDRQDRARGSLLVLR